MAETDLSEVVIADEPLTSSNYESWKVYMQNYLSNLNLWGIVNGTESEPAAPFEDEEYSTWVLKCELAFSTIKASCGPEMFRHLKGIKSAKEAWDKLAMMQSTEVNRASSTEENDVVVEIQHDDNEPAVPETQVITHLRSLKPDAFSKPKSRFVEPMEPASLYNDDRPDAVTEIEESFADAMKKYQEIWGDVSFCWSDDEPAYIKFRPLYKALLEGDWETAKEIIDDYPEALSAKITSRGETVLHAAVVSGKLSTVKELLELLPPEALEAKTSSGETAISFSAFDGTTEIAKLMVEKNDRVLQITTIFGLIPLVMSIHNNKKDMFRYLYSVTPKEELDPDKSKNGASFLNGAIKAEMFDVALEVLELYPKLAISKDMFGSAPIGVLSQNGCMFPSGSRFGFWQRCIYSCIPIDGRQRSPKSSISKQSIIDVKSSGSRFGSWLQYLYSSCLCVVPGVKDLQKKKRKHVQVLRLLKVICSAIGHLTNEELKDEKVYDTMLATAANGNIEVFQELFDANPSLLYTSFSGSRKTLYHLAVLARQESIFNFISSMGQRDLRATHKDKSENNLLHYAGRLPPSSQLDKISGAALQMQREIQWFQ
ncbi:hypothetical protein MKW94_017500, partial [Papaver nudicaule]|nr:hypothetical protein [Papaver nudicaule]